MDNIELIEKAYRAMENTYAPYSKFKVGAAALCGEKVFTGCNIENSSYGATICAERVAIAKAVSEGFTSIDKIAIVCSKHDYAMPCGICRQVMTEFMDITGSVIVTNDKEIKEFNLSELIPESFKLS